MCLRCETDAAAPAALSAARGALPAMTDWVCEAYGPEGVEVGALCFFAGDLGGRVCASAGVCHERMADERRRVFQRINELAAAGDPVMEHLAGEFPAPGDLLDGTKPDAPGRP